MRGETTARGRAFAALAVSAVLVAASCRPERAMPSVSEQPFGLVPGGAEVRLFTLDNGRGMRATITNYGGIVTSLLVPDSAGQVADVVLGYDSLVGYLLRSPYFGAVVGRYANRVARARFVLDGATYSLAPNDNGNSLHGGVVGFDKVVWEAEPFQDSTQAGVHLRYVSRDGEEGYPGQLTVAVSYALTDSNTLRIEYRATTDQPTVVNLSHHGYFNLAGHDAGDILGHELTILAERFTPIDSLLIPTGELRSVEGTPFDFRTPTAIGARIAQDDPQLRYGLGYDHNWVLDAGQTRQPRLVATLRDPVSGRTMEVLTTEPGLQLYSGNFLDGTNVGKRGVPYGHRTGLCLETQHFPDSPNRPSFPSTELRPGGAYHSTTIYRFVSR